MNLNKGCIEIAYAVVVIVCLSSMNLNKGCIEMASGHLPIPPYMQMNLNKGCIEIDCYAFAWCVIYDEP